MTFLNLPLAFGAAAFAVPLVIHILNRSRYRTVQWGAMPLLESVIVVNHKRFHLEQLLLLLIRCLIPVLLAFCMARPVLMGSRALEGDAPTSMVILLDNSYSMEAIGPQGSPFERAVNAACDLVTATERGSEIAVILTGGRPTPLFDQPVFDKEAVLRRLRLLQPGYGASDMSLAMEAGLVTLADMKHVHRELIVISDFQPPDWEALRNDAQESFRRRLNAMTIKPALTLLPVGEHTKGNVSLDSLDFSRQALGIGQPLSVRATVRSHGQHNNRTAKVVLKIDDVEHAVSQITLSDQAETQVLFSCSFDAAGSHVLEAEVRIEDSLPSDNRLAAAVTVRDRISVLLVDGVPSTQPLQSETDFLSVALTPYTFGRLQLADLIESRTITAAQLNAEELTKAQVVVLANVAQLSDAQLPLLNAYVRDGGALMVFAGNRINVDWYNRQLFAAGNGLLPGEFVSPEGNINEQGRSVHILRQRFDHPALEFFNDQAHGDLSTAEIRQWYRIAVPTTENPDVVTMARLDNGDALLVERRAGDGVVVQVATACDADWSDLPQRPVYVPFVQQLVTTLASQVTPPQNIGTGEPAVVVFSGEFGNPSLVVTTPDGSQRTVTATRKGTMNLARFDATQRPGIYTVTTPDAKRIHVVSATSRNESVLDILNEEQLTRLAEVLQAAVIRTSAEYLDQDRLRRNGQEVWQLVLMTLLFLMAMELVLQQRFARVQV